VTESNQRPGVCGDSTNNSCGGSSSKADPAHSTVGGIGRKRYHILVNSTDISEGVEGKDSSERKLLCLDTMCNHGLTQYRELVGVLCGDITFEMTGHCGEPVVAKQHGSSSFFGKLIYTTDANYTLLCYFDVQHYWTITWETSVKCVCRNKKDPTLVLVFTMTLVGERNKLLVCDATDVWHRLIHHKEHVNINPSVTETLYSSNIDAMSYRRALELIRFHNISGHPSGDQMKRMFACNTLGNCPFISHDVDLMETIMGGQCACCMVGKSTNKSLAKRKRKSTPVVKQERRVDLVDEHERPELSDDEILGCDLMFLEGAVYLICVGFKRKFLHGVCIANKTASECQRAIKAIKTNEVYSLSNNH